MAPTQAQSGASYKAEVLVITGSTAILLAVQDVVDVDVVEAEVALESPAAEVAEEEEELEAEVNHSRYHGT
jgi:hypothetical protein